MKPNRPWQSLKNLFAARSRATRRRATKVSHRPAEMLEQRQLLSATMAGAQDVQAPVSEPGFELKDDGTLVITGSEGNDSVYLRNNYGYDPNGNYTVLSREVVMEGNGTTKTFQLTDQVKQIRASLGAGNDSFGGGWNGEIDVPRTVFGEAGDDILWGSSRNDVIDGGLGNDSINGGFGNDVLIGGEGNDLVNGDFGNDTIFGGRGDDSLWGGSGNDVINGQGGRDTLFDSGRLYVQWPGRAHTADMPLPIVLELTDSRLREFRLHTLLTSTRTTTSQELVDTDSLIGIESADLGGTWADDRIDASLFSGSVTLNGGDGNDTLIGGRGNDVISGGYGDDVIEGGAGNDQLDGQQGNDVVRGGDGNDTISGGAGSDTLDGQAGRDTLVEFTDRLNESNQRPDYGWWGDRIITLEYRPEYVLIGIGGDTTPRFTLNDQSLKSGTYEDSLANFEAAKITGGSNAEVIDARGFSGSVTLDGGSGDDTLRGGRSDDVLLGGNGNDVLHGGGGNDKLRGQEGSDRLFGEDGNDTLDGGAGHDLLEGGAGNNRYQAFDANRIQRAQVGRPTLDAGPKGGDVIIVGSTHDVAVQRRMTLDSADVVVTRRQILRSEAASDALFAGNIADLLAALR